MAEEHNSMTNLNQENLIDKANLIRDKLRTSYTYWNLKRLLKEEIIKPKYKVADVHEILPRLVKEMGLDIQLKNKINEIHETIVSGHSNLAVALKNGLNPHVAIPDLPDFFTREHFEPLASLDKLRDSWSNEVKRRIGIVATEMGTPYVKRRLEPWVYALQEPVTQAEDTPDVDLLDAPAEKISTFIYDQDNFFEYMLSADNKNYAFNIEWGMLKLHLRTLPIDQLRSQYEELDVGYKQIGIDEDRSFLDERQLLGEKLLARDYVPYMVQYAKRGIPHGLRVRFYKKLLDIQLTHQTGAYFEYLQEHINRWELLTDQIIREDCADVANDDKYFIFHDLLEKIVMCMLRDPWIVKNIKSLSTIPMACKSGNGKSVGFFPPSGVLPMRYFCRFAAPFTFASEKHDECYFLARNFYAKYMCYLHSLTSESNGIISLCRLFEDTLQAYQSEMVFHLNQIGINPLKVALPWIFYSFVGYLEVEQIYLLWDRVLGYDTLDIIPLAAVSIFDFRAEAIMQAGNQDEFYDLFYDMSQIQIIPILQNFLFIKKLIV